MQWYYTNKLQEKKIQISEFRDEFIIALGKVDDQIISPRSNKH